MTDLNRTMTRDGLIEVMARAQVAYLYPTTEGYPGYDDLAPEAIEILHACATAALAAIEAAGVRLVPVEASCELEFARMADGTVKVGYNPRTEEGGWTLIGDVTKAVTAIEAQRNNALRDLDIANQRLSNVFAALAASPYAPQKDESND